MDLPKLILGGLHTDERGTVAFVNGFNFAGVKRFYTIRPRQKGQIRGWVGHRREQKWFTVVQGSVLIAVVKPDKWDNPSANLPVERFTLSAAEPAVLHVPPGHATASVSLSPEAILTVFSSSRLDEAAADDYRFPSGHWNAAGIRTS